MQTTGGEDSFIIDGSLYPNSPDPYYIHLQFFGPAFPEKLQSSSNGWIEQIWFEPDAPSIHGHLKRRYSNADGNFEVLPRSNPSRIPEEVYSRQKSFIVYYC